VTSAESVNGALGIREGRHGATRARVMRRLGIATFSIVSRRSTCAGAAAPGAADLWIVSDELHMRMRLSFLAGRSMSGRSGRSAYRGRESDRGFRVELQEPGL
jgi:hypothetical protein